MSYDVLLTRPAIARENITAQKPDKTPSPSKDKGATEALKSSTNTPSKKVSSSKFGIQFPQFHVNVNDTKINVSNGPSTSTNTANNKNKSTDESFPELKGKVESKLMSMWHNVKYGWSGKMKTNFSREQPVWLLGRCYHRKLTPYSSMENSAELTLNVENKLVLKDAPVIGEEGEDTRIPEIGTDVIEGATTESAWEEDEGIEGFKKDFVSRLWMTYRREFPILNGSNYTSDCGWGCMLRSGQMLLAQALLCHFLGRSWRFDPETQLHATHEDNLHRKIIRWFGDSSSKNSPFSIHTLVNLGIDSGKKPGDWYGPSSVSNLLKQAVKLASQEIADLDGLNVYVAQNCTVYLLDVFDECLVPDKSTVPMAPWQKTSNDLSTSTSPLHQPNVNWKSLVLLVPLRLGAEKMNPVYANSLKALLSTENCIGIIGGRPKHSLYFVGFQEDKLIHLDPHYCQENVDVNQENFLVQSFHCKSPRKMKLSKMDPCCCIGFYCQTKTDFDNFVASVQPYLLPIRSPQPDRSNINQQNEVNYPMFVFCRGRKSEHEEEIRCNYYNSAQHLSKEQYPDDDDDDDTEEFVIL